GVNPTPVVSTNPSRPAIIGARIGVIAGVIAPEKSTRRVPIEPWSIFGVPSGIGILTGKVETKLSVSHARGYGFGIGRSPASSGVVPSRNDRSAGLASGYSSPTHTSPLTRVGSALIEK